MATVESLFGDDMIDLTMEVGVVPFDINDAQLSVTDGVLTVTSAINLDFEFEVLGQTAIMNVDGPFVLTGMLPDMTTLVGDVNCDGVVDLLDIGPFVDLLVSGGFSEKADANQDGQLDLLDVQAFVEILVG